MRKFFGFVIFSLSSMFLMLAYADTVTLQNGNTVVGKITEQTDKYIKVDTEGTVLTFYTDEIKSINKNKDSSGPIQTPTPLLSNVGIKEGSWSVTILTKIKGSDLPTQQLATSSMANFYNNEMKKHDPNFQMNSNTQGITTTSTKCVTKENPYPIAQNAQYCQGTHEVIGSTVTFHETCNTMGTQVEQAGHVTYKGDSMEGEITSHIITNGLNMKRTNQITGKYLGPC